MSVPPGAVREFVDLLAEPDRRRAADFVTDVAGGGASTEELILELLAPAEREVGMRWARREWNVAQEHAATAIVDWVLARVSLDDGGPPTAGRLVIACVEGEWHSLPARMAAELVRLQGWEVTFLGPSVPADDLAEHVRHLAPDAVGLSCSVPLFLKGAQRSIAACRTAGAAVVTGGAGFGTDGRYAATVGADAWAPDPRSVPALLHDGVANGGRAASPGAEDIVLEAIRPDLVAATVEVVLERSTPSLAPDSLAQLREAADALVTSVETACLVEHADVVTECLPMIERLLPDDLVTRASGTELLERLVPTVRRHSLRAAGLAEEALRTAVRR